MGRVAEPKTILYIDDQRDSLDAFHAHFEKRGDKVLTASTGKEGLELLAGNRVDAVVLDYQMPGMSGGAVLQIVKRVRPGVPILVLTERSTVIPQDVRNATTVVPTQREFAPLGRNRVQNSVSSSHRHRGGDFRLRRWKFVGAEPLSAVRLRYVFSYAAGMACHGWHGERGGHSPK